jgi:hypothetical protein
MSPPYNFRDMLLRKKHINATRGFFHGNILQGDKVVFTAHVSIGLKDFILDNL